MQSEGSSNKKISIYFIVPAPLGVSPGQRFRFEHYLHILSEKGFINKISSFYTYKGWSILYSRRNYLPKLVLVLGGFRRRIYDLFFLKKYDYIYLYREAMPIGPPIFEWIIVKFFKKRIIYDFDDAIWVPAISDQNKIVYYLKWFSKIRVICKISFKVSVGNDFLKKFASKYNNDVSVIPTVVETDLLHNVLQSQVTKYPVVGWTGTFSTLKYLDIIVPVLEKLQKEIPFLFLVIADKDPKLPLKNYKFLPWNKDSEIPDLLNMHIGVMPLHNEETEKGKCGFKAIQYMALGIPALVSPVGVNTIIVDDGVNGYICYNPEDWEKYIRQLINDAGLREKIGKNARDKISQYYSVKSTAASFLNLFE